MGQLEESRAAVVAEVGALTEAQWTWRASDGRWTAQEIVEHLILVERGVVVLTRRALSTPPIERTAPITDDELWAKLTGNNRGAAPERVQPTGQWTERAAALEEWLRRREETIAFAATADPSWRERWIQLPVGQVDCAQAIIMLAGHAVRHLAQLRTLRAEPGFPTV